jgi:phosphoribosylglycinamide formyltransferase-1
MQAIIDATKDGRIDADVAMVLSNRADAGGLHKAEQAGIPTCIIEHSAYDSREQFDEAMMAVIDPLQPDLVVLAGFMRILSPAFIRHYHDRLINIHPSLLPRYKGLDTHRRAIDNGDTLHGASVHYVSDELDSGPVVIQAIVHVAADDDTASLAARVLEQEHVIYPIAIQYHISGRIIVSDQCLLFDGKELKKPIRWENDELKSE